MKKLFVLFVFMLSFVFTVDAKATAKEAYSFLLQTSDGWVSISDTQKEIYETGVYKNIDLNTQEYVTITGDTRVYKDFLSYTDKSLFTEELYTNLDEKEFKRFIGNFIGTIFMELLETDHNSYGIAGLLAAEEEAYRGTTIIKDKGIDTEMKYVALKGKLLGYEEEPTLDGTELLDKAIDGVDDLTDSQKEKTKDILDNIAKNNGEVSFGDTLEIADVATDGFFSSIFTGIALFLGLVIFLILFIIVMIVVVVKKNAKRKREIQINQQDQQYNNYIQPDQQYNNYTQPNQQYNNYYQNEYRENER